MDIYYMVKQDAESLLCFYTAKQGSYQYISSIGIHQLDLNSSRKGG